MEKRVIVQFTRFSPEARVVENKSSCLIYVKIGSSIDLLVRLTNNNTITYVMTHELI